MKANPAPEVVSLLAGLGSNSDVASPSEIALCLDHGVSADRISFGNTIKKERDIAYAFAHGLTLYAFDSAGELEKIARAAPGARVFCRILVGATARRRARNADRKLRAKIAEVSEELVLQPVREVLAGYETARRGLDQALR